MYPFASSSCPIRTCHPTPILPEAATFKMHALFQVNRLCHREHLNCHLQIFLLIPVFRFPLFSPKDRSFSVIFHFNWSHFIFVTFYFLQISKLSRAPTTCSFSFFSPISHHLRNSLSCHASIQHSLLGFSYKLRPHTYFHLLPS